MNKLPEQGLPAVEAVTGRRSVRRFLPTAVSEQTIDAILQAASRAASGTNIQPWLVHVVTGESRDRLSRAVLAAAQADETSLEYRYLPERMKEPYLSRRRKLGHDLYALYGIDRDDIAARKAAMLRNYEFFGAPVGLFFTMERDMALGAWLDCGMFMQNVMVVARAHGLETCPQQAWCDFGAVVHRELAIPDSLILLSGMALGYADSSAIENKLVSDRIGVDEFTTWHR
ncbi:nitroreductase [Rhizorhapis suberifaciens]|uniref:Nitroreductase n=1 Tax=Rhizorhapis suberifaciens TaxID=13656 RepID=A0A840I011_9SPHN|nr:nitroreductase [Rhizorhapis suberifaciens]MBB4642996.1 nitroreductase [Rhizorhapis suberifaciens]